MTTRMIRSHFQMVISQSFQIQDTFPLCTPKDHQLDIFHFPVKLAVDCSPVFGHHMKSVLSSFFVSAAILLILVRIIK